MLGHCGRALLVLSLFVGGCARKTVLLLDIDYKPVTEHERVLLEEKRRGLDEGLAAGSFKRFFVGPRIERVEIRLEQPEELPARLKELAFPILGCVGPLRSGRATAVAPSLAQAELTCIAPVATDPVLASLPGLFTLSPNDRQIGRALGAIARKHLAANRIAILKAAVPDDELTRLVDGFIEATSGAEVSTITLPASQDPVEIFESLRSIAAQKWDLVFVDAHFIDALEILQGLVGKGSTEFAVMGLDSWNNAAFLQDISGLSARILIPQFFRRPEEQSDASTVLLATKEAVTLFLRNKEPLAELRSFDGTTGHLTCDGKNCLGTIGLYEAKTGKLIPNGAWDLHELF